MKMLPKHKFKYAEPANAQFNTPELPGTCCALSQGTIQRNEIQSHAHSGKTNRMELLITVIR